MLGPVTARDVDRAVAALASRQHGVFARAQALAAGASAPLVQRRRRAGAWIDEAPGVYGLAGGVHTSTRRVMVACLDLGPARWRRTARPPCSTRSRAPDPARPRSPCRPGLVEAGGGGSTSRPSAPTTAERSRASQPRPSPGPCSTWPASSAPGTSSRWSTRAGRRPPPARSADCQGVGAAPTGPPRLRRPGRHPGGARTGVRAAGQRAGGAAVRGAAASGLPDPVRQHRLPSVGAGRVDAAYPESRLIVEVDGRRWHTRVEDFERDRRRDIEAGLLGWRVVRFAWSDVVRTPGWVCDVVATHLRRAA